MSYMKKLTVLVFAITFLSQFGCGSKDNNSKNQTPNDQPIGAPKEVDRGQKVKE